MVPPNELHPQFITTEDGTKTSVVLPIEEYQSLLEDLNDLAIVAERRVDSSVSHSDLISELKQDGLL